MSKQCEKCGKEVEIALPVYYPFRCEGKIEWLQLGSYCASCAEQLNGTQPPFLIAPMRMNNV